MAARMVHTYASDDGLVRRVKVVVADPSLDEHGRRFKAPVFFEWPVQKLVLLMACSEALMEDQGFPTEEPQNDAYFKEENNEKKHFCC